MSMEQRRKKLKKLGREQNYPEASIIERFHQTYRQPGSQDYGFGKTPLEIIESAKKYTCPSSITFLRKAVLHSMGLRRHDNAENLIITGCVTPFGMPRQLSNYFKLMEHLGIAYTFIRDTEYCCGAPALNYARGSERAAADAGAGELMGMNLAQAQKLGVKNMFYFCYQCVGVAQKHLDNSGIAQMYFPDIMIGKVEKQTLRVKPTLAGYYEGCWLRPLDVNPELRIPLEMYRSWLDSIEGLEIVELRHSTCCATPKGLSQLIEEAKNKKVSCIITPCTGCFVHLEGYRNGVPVKLVTDILLEAVETQQK